MGVNYYQQDDYNKKITGQQSAQQVTETPAVAPAEIQKSPVKIIDESKDEKPKTGLEVEKNTSAPVTKEETLEDRIAYLNNLINSDQATEAQIQEFNELKKGQARATQKGNDFIMQQEKVADTVAVKSANEREEKYTAAQKEAFKVKFTEYERLKVQGGTDYEKTSRILDKYLSEYDASYKELQDKLANIKDQKQKAEVEKQLRAKRDVVIHDWQHVVNPGIKNRDLTLKDRQRGIREIGKIFSIAGASETKIEDLARFKDEKILAKIKTNKYEEDKFDEILNSVDLSSNISTDEKIHQFADAYLTRLDSKYNSLQGKAKEEYLQKKFADMISDQLWIKISPEMLNSERAKILKEIVVGMVSEAKKDNGSLELSFEKDPKKLAQKILKYFGKQEEFIKNLSESEKEDLNKFQVKMQIVAESKSSDKNITEKDIYNSLKSKSNPTKAEKLLLEEYKKYEKYGVSLDKEFSLRNAMTLSIVLGKEISGTKDSIENLAFNYVKDTIDPNKSFDPKERDVRFENCLSMFGGSEHASKIQMSLLDKYKAAQNASEEQMTTYKNQRALKRILLTEYRKAQAKADYRNPESIENYGAATANMANVKLSKDEMEDIKNSRSKMDYETILAANTDKNYRTGLKKNDQLMAAVSTSDANTRTTEQIKKIGLQLKSIGDNDFSSAYSKSLIQYASPDKQVPIQKELLSVHDAAITEGVAAATKFVDASVRDKYSENLNKEINSGYYSDKEKQNIKTAQETGQTSYDRAQAQQNSSSEKSEPYRNNDSEGASETQKIANSMPNYSSSPATAKKSQIFTLSTESRNMIANISKLDSENKKAEAIKKVADNIAKIQKGIIEQEKKKALKDEERVKIQKAEETKKAVEQAKIENDKKKAEQLNSELLKVVESDISEIQAELPPEDVAEVQKALGDMYEDLKSYAQAGQLNMVYNLLGKLPNSSIQEKFLEKLATKHISTISHFIQGADKSVVKQLCELNPGLISTLDTNSLKTLCDSGFSKPMILKYGDKNQVAGMLANLQLNSSKETLNQFYEVMGLKRDDNLETDASKIVKKNDDELENIPGSDKWYASLSSNTVGNSKFEDGKTRLKMKYPPEFLT